MSFEDKLFAAVIACLLSIGIPSFMQTSGRMSKRVGTVWVVSSVLALFATISLLVFWGDWKNVLLWTLSSQLIILGVFAVGFTFIGAAEYGDPFAYHRLVLFGRQPAGPSAFEDPE